MICLSYNSIICLGEVQIVLAMIDGSNFLDRKEADGYLCICLLA